MKPEAIAADSASRVCSEGNISRNTDQSVASVPAPRLSTYRRRCASSGPSDRQPHRPCNLFWCPSQDALSHAASTVPIRAPCRDITSLDTARCPCLSDPTSGYTQILQYCMHMLMSPEAALLIKQLAGQNSRTLRFQEDTGVQQTALSCS